MREIAICILGIIIMGLAFTLMELEDQTRLTKEQNKMLITYCKALPACKKEMER